jgi:hypothetical protein
LVWEGTVVCWGLNENLPAGRLLTQFIVGQGKALPAKVQVAEILAESEVRKSDPWPLSMVSEQMGVGSWIGSEQVVEPSRLAAVMVAAPPTGADIVEKRVIASGLNELSCAAVWVGLKEYLPAGRVEVQANSGQGVGLPAKVQVAWTFAESVVRKSEPCALSITSEQMGTPTLSVKLPEQVLAVLPHGWPDGVSGTLKLIV